MNNQFVFTVPKVQYDPYSVKNYVESLKPYRRIKILPWRNIDEYRARFTGISIDDPRIPASVVSNKNDMMIDPSQLNLIYDFSKDNFLGDLFNKTGIAHNEIFVIEIIYYKQGYTFQPHTDALIKCKIMIPAALESQSIMPIDFYNSNTGIIKLGKNYDVDDISLAYTHIYSNTFPTIINTQAIHGVQSMLYERTMITVGLLIDFNDFYNRCKYLNIT